MMKASSAAACLLFLLFLSCIDCDAFFSFKRIPKLQDSLEANNPTVEVFNHEAHQVQKPRFKRIFKKVSPNEEPFDEVARSLKAAQVADKQRKAATRTLDAIVSENVQSTVSDKHLESVAKSMKTVLAAKIQNSNHEFFGRSQSHLPRGIQAKIKIQVDHIPKPVSKSIKLLAEHVSSQDLSKEVDHSLASVAKSMRAVVDKVESQHEGQSVIQGFKVEGDSSNKIVFLDLEALKSLGISLDNSRISLGSSGLGRNLEPIEGLEAKSSNFQSIVEQKLEADLQSEDAQSHHQRTPIKPTVAVKHVSASQAVSAGLNQVALGSRITVPTGDITVIRPQTNTGSAAQRKSLFFGKFEGRNTGKPSPSTNQVSIWLLIITFLTSHVLQDHHQDSTTARVLQPVFQESRILSDNHHRGGEVRAHSLASQPSQQEEVHDVHQQQLKHFGFGGF